MKDDIWAAVASTERAGNVPAMTAMLPNTELHWYVREGEGAEYRYAGAAWVHEVAGRLCEQRNAALHDAFRRGHYCLQLDDDLVGSKIVHQQESGTWGWGTLAPETAYMQLRTALDASPLYRAGGAPTANAFFFNPQKPVRTNLYMLNGVTLTKPNPLRFDIALRLKEDYDMVLQHLVVHGGVLRLDYLYFQNKQRTNRGGCVSYRTAEEEDAAIAYLEHKWGALIRKNPRRPHEILLHWRGERVEVDAVTRATAQGTPVMAG